MAVCGVAPLVNTARVGLPSRRRSSRTTRPRANKREYRRAASDPMSQNFCATVLASRYASSPAKISFEREKKSRRIKINPTQVVAAINAKG